MSIESLRVKEENWTKETQGERLYEILREKVEFVKGLETLMDSITSDEAPNRVEQKLRDYFDVLTRSSPLLYERLQEYNRLHEEALGVYEERISRFETTGMDKEPRASELFDALVRFRKEGGADMQFFISVYNGIKHLIEHNALIYRIKDDHNKIAQAVNECIQNDFTLTPDHITEVSIKPFAINIRVNEEALAQLHDRGAEGGHILGFHEHNSPFNLIGENADKATEPHEEIHAKLDGFALLNSPPSRTVQSVLSPSSNFLSQRAREDEEIQKKNRLLSLSARELVDKTHGELLADLDMIENLLPRTMISTARTEVELCVTILRRKTADEDQQVAAKCRELARTMLQQFSRATEEMELALFVGNRAGRTYDTHALLSLLSPSKFKRINRYLQRDLGSEFDGLSRAYAMIRGDYTDFPSSAVGRLLGVVATPTDHMDFSPKALERVIAIAVKLSETDKQRIKMRIENIFETEGDAFYLKNAGIRDVPLEQLRYYADVFKTFYEALDFSEEEREMMLEQLFSNSFYLFIEQNAWKQPTKLADRFQELNEREKAIFRDALEHYFSDGLAGDDLPEPWDSFEELIVMARKYPLWTIAERAGFLADIERGLEELHKMLENSLRI